jgi:hypothetical protein
MAETFAVAAVAAAAWWVLLGPPQAWITTWPGWARLTALGLGMLVTAILVAAAARWTRTAIWAAPAIAAVTLIVMLHAMPPTDANRVAQAAATNDLQAELGVLEDFTAQRQNALRLLNISRPEEVRQAGTQTSEEFVAAMAHLARYTRVSDGEGLGWGLFGRGFLNLEPPTVLKAYHFDDDVSAVHLIAPFGRLGAAAMLAVLWAMALIAVPARGDAPDGAPGTVPAWRPVAARLALWTIALVGSYMVLANLQFVPFTGKNVYFTAATSFADLLEGALLMALALAFSRTADA